MKEMEIVFEKIDEPDTFVAPQYLPETHPVEDLYEIAANGMQQKAYYVRLPLYFFRNSKMHAENILSRSSKKMQKRALCATRNKRKKYDCRQYKSIL